MQILGDFPSGHPLGSFLVSEYLVQRTILGYLHIIISYLVLYILHLLRSGTVVLFVPAYRIPQGIVLRSRIDPDSTHYLLPFVMYNFPV